MKHRFSLILSALCCVSAVVRAEPAVVLTPGLWHLTNVSTHPLIGRKEKTKDRCFDSKLVSDWSIDPNRLLGDQKQQCQTIQFVKKGNYLSWKVHCTEKVDLTGTVEVWLDSAGAYHGKGSMKSEGMWPPGELKSEFSGVFMGDCPPAVQ